MRRFLLAATALGLLAEACGGTRGASSPPFFGISGTVSGATGVAVDLTGAASASTTADANGGYSFSSLATGSYVVTPSKSGYTFLPASIAVTVAGADVTGQDFTASAAATVHGIYGTVSGLVAAGVGISLGGAATASTTTDAEGKYSFTGLADGYYVVTPNESGYTFFPASIAVIIAGADVTGQDFTASAVGTHSISGTVSGLVTAGVGISLGGGATASTTTDAFGIYSFSGLANGDYVVTPSESGYTFSPASIAVTMAGADVTGQNFTAMGRGDWSNVPSGTTKALSGVWGSSSSDVWVVGESGTILHWDGNAWSPVRSRTRNSLSSVWGSSSNDVWAVGESGSILHWDGSAWSGVPSHTASWLGRVWGSSPNDVWALSDPGTILHWDGSAWSSLPSGTTNPLYAIWGTASNDVWAAGWLCVVVHWDGSAWSTAIPGYNINAYLDGIWGSSSTDLWMVGGVLDSMSGILSHWDGSAWSSPNFWVRGLLNGVWGSTPDDVWAVGQALLVSAQAKGLILHWNGSSWAVDAYEAAYLADVRGSSATDVWVVGELGTILHFGQ